MAVDDLRAVGRRMPGQPVKLWVWAEGDGTPQASFEARAEATVILVPVPLGAEALLELHSAVATTMRAVADVDNNKDAVKKLRMMTAQERNQPQVNESLVVQKLPLETASPWRAPSRDVQREHQDATTQSTRAMSAGLPESNQSRH
jgi:hypothetical protein